MIMLLCACAGGPAAVDESESLALSIRQEYLSKTSCLCQADVTADYGQRVYQYKMEVTSSAEETAVVLSAPETVAGIAARLKNGESALEFDGLFVETGPLSPDGLTPLSAVPALLEAARSGYIRACAFEEEGALLRVDCGDPEGAPGTGTEYALWFDAASHALKRGEVSVDGRMVISCEFTALTLT